MDKRVANAEAVIGRVKDGATILMGAFGTCGVPENLIRALVKQGARNLTVASNNPGIDGYGIGLLLENRQVKKLIASYVGSNKFFEKLALNNEIEMELNPQGRWLSACAPPAPGFRRFSRRPDMARWRRREKKCANSTAASTCWSPRCAAISRS